LIKINTQDSNQNEETSLPIDITAIRNQTPQQSQITTRIGANLFTEDAMRINQVLENRIQQRQQSGQTLFEAIHFEYTFDPHERILNTAENLTLFDTPTNFSNINSSSETNEISYWVLISFITIGIFAGLSLAYNSSKKQKRYKNGVH
jgi:hypothetical protein